MLILEISLIEFNFFLWMFTKNIVIDRYFNKQMSVIKKKTFNKTFIYKIWV